jgi:flagellin
MSILAMSISSTTPLTTTASGASATLQNMLADVNTLITGMENAASTLGSAISSNSTQTSFVSSMQTNLTNGVASLVDANMNEVSTRLQALQTQQQLGVQSLSIANQSSQMILKLFQ